ncbi:MAG: type-F conjugative transfer system secretin TraK, partial [Legionella sp.]|nr:type-F conjugative transfer system secretin TraK [Legionella sp.]
MPNSTYYKAKKLVFLIILAGSGMACAGAIPSVIAFEEGEQFNMTLSNINFNR